MFIPTWLIFLGTGITMSVWALVWGVKNHQFDDQDRARYLGICDLRPAELALTPPIQRGFTLYVIVALIACGPLSVIWGLYVALRTL